MFTLLNTKHKTPKKVQSTLNNMMCYFSTTRISLDHIPDNCNSKDVEIFSLLLGNYQDKRQFSRTSGAYLSALINNSDDEEFKIHTKYLVNPPESLGHGNSGKRIVVEGNVGNYLGSYMKDGKIIVQGNVGRDLGSHMKDGEIVVNGDVGDWIGLFLILVIILSFLYS